MAHVTGQLDCAYCRHFRAEPSCEKQFGSAGWCAFHETELGASEDHRLCRQLMPTEAYDRDHPRRLVDGVFVQRTVFEQLSLFELQLEPGSLYTYPTGDFESVCLTQQLHPGSGPSAPRDDQRHRLEAALLEDDLFPSLWAVVEQLRREQVSDNLIHPLLDEYVQMLSGNIEQVTALQRAMGNLSPDISNESDNASDVNASEMESD